jgi:hypothetical protein
MEAAVVSPCREATFHEITEVQTEFPDLQSMQIRAVGREQIHNAASGPLKNDSQYGVYS